MTDRIDEALHDCLRRLESGDDRDEVLASWPDDAPAVAPLLAVAEAYRSLALPPLADGDRAAVRRALVQSAAGRGPAAPGRRHRLLATAAALGLLWLGTMGALRAAEPALPGDSLYPLKRAVESLELGLSRAPARLALALAERRLAEAAALVAAGRSPAPALAALDELAPSLAALPAEATAVAGRRDRFLAGPAGQVAGLSPAPGATPVLRRLAALPPATVTRSSALATATRPAARNRPVAVARMPGPAEPTAAAASATHVVATATSPPATQEDERAAPSPAATATPSPTPARTGLSGRVTDAAGQGLAGAVVRAHALPLDPGRFVLVTTATDGSYFLALEPGDYKVAAELPGFRERWYRDADDAEEALAVTVVAGLEGAGIDIALTPALGMAP